jgi:hypothetical protein
MTEQGYEAEQEAIRKAILDYYSKGHDTCDPTLYEEILHPQWRFMLFDSEGELMTVDRPEYCSWYNPQDADPQIRWETEFYSIDVTENIGAVKLRLECQKVRYIDYFHLMKMDGRWWIVHKMSHNTHKSKAKKPQEEVG